MSKKITITEKKALVIMALLGGKGMDIPVQVIGSVGKLSQKKHVRVWQYGGTKVFVLTDKGWRLVLQFCRPIKSEIYQALKAIYKEYKQPEFKLGREIFYE